MHRCFRALICARGRGSATKCSTSRPTHNRTTQGWIFQGYTKLSEYGTCTTYGYAGAHTNVGVGSRDLSPSVALPQTVSVCVSPRGTGACATQRDKRRTRRPAIRTKVPVLFTRKITLNDHKCGACHPLRSQILGRELRQIIRRGCRLDAQCGCKADEKRVRKTAQHQPKRHQWLAIEKSPCSLAAASPRRGRLVFLGPQTM